mmetsp:Transcript_141841/g.261222  ORF Transcript_141841/g.261222 Transcript_141841/m.261222 type:complete len:262 (-) Transcript_141841:3107-3892(-)
MLLQQVLHQVVRLVLSTCQQRLHGAESRQRRQCGVESQQQRSQLLITLRREVRSLKASRSQELPRMTANGSAESSRRCSASSRLRSRRGNVERSRSNNDSKRRTCFWRHASGRRWRLAQACHLPPHALRAAAAPIPLATLPPIQALHRQPLHRHRGSRNLHSLHSPQQHLHSPQQRSQQLLQHRRRPRPAALPLSATTSGRSGGSSSRRSGNASSLNRQRQRATRKRKQSVGAWKKSVSRKSAFSVKSRSRMLLERLKPGG